MDADVLCIATFHYATGETLRTIASDIGLIPNGSFRC